MLRALPVAGHPIRFRAISQAFLGKAKQETFLKEWKGNIQLVSSGSAALTLALESLKHQSLKRQVILPAYTCPSVIASVIRVGLDPILCDLKPWCFQMDLDHLISKIGSNTLAVIAVHLFGIPENVIELKRITGENDIILIEDAAQAFGNKLSFNGMNKNLGSFGDLGIFSFGRGKPFSLLAGGAILVNDPKLQEPVQKFYDSLSQNGHSLLTLHYFLNLFLYSIFYYPKLYWIPQGIPLLKLGETIFTTDYRVERINPNVVRLGNTLIVGFDEIRKKRLELSKVYIKKLKPLRKEFVFFPELDGEEVTFLRFPIIFKDKEKRDRTLVELKKRGLGASGMYPVPLSEQEGVPSHLKSNESFPNAKFISERILTLPLHEKVKVEDIDRSCEIIERCLGN